MAKFLKVVSLDATNPEVLIGIDKILRVAAGDDTGVDANESVTIFLDGAAYVTIYFFGGELRPGDVLKAVNAAMTANPGGIISTVNRPLLTEQVVAPSNSGRQLITTEATYVAYTGIGFGII